jgi:hypothetical protein
MAWSARISFAALAVGVLLPTPAARAQQAICDCCMTPYTVPGARWIGTARGYGGLCGQCRDECLDCRDKAEDVKAQYETWNGMKNRGGMSKAQSALVDWLINRSRQRWADLRWACLAAGGPDNGRLDPMTRDNAPSQGFNKPGLRNTAAETRRRVREFRDDLNRNIDLFVGDPSTFRKLAEAHDYLDGLERNADHLDRLADDPPDPDFDKVAEPKVAPLPKVEGKARESMHGPRAVGAIRNSNAYTDAYITALERYQGAAKAGRKDARERQVHAMARYGRLAAEEAVTAAVEFYELEKILLKAAQERQRSLDAKGTKRADALKAVQAMVKDGWPADLRAALKDGGASDASAEALRKALIALTPEQAEQATADYRQRIELIELAAGQLAGKRTPRGRPLSAALSLEPPQMPGLDMMSGYAHVLHAANKGRNVDLPKDNPFKE